MLKKKKWFKKFRFYLRGLEFNEEVIYTFAYGANKERMFETLTPKEAISEYVEYTGDLDYANKSGS